MNMKNVTVVGAGTMGHALAQVFAQGGYRVFLTDLREEILDQARTLIAANLETLTGLGLAEASSMSQVLDRIRFTTSLSEAASEADLVVEAIVENPQAKKEMFAELDRLAPAGAILASNTSYLDIYRFVETRRPEKVVITHWFAPPHIVPLVEIVPGPQTSVETVTAVQAVLEGLGKQTIVVKKFLPGFIVNRLQAALGREVLFLLENGYASPEDIDKATKNSFGLRIPILGLVRRMDFAGLDLVKHVMANKSYTPPPDQDHSPLIDELVSQGRLGVKSGQGFFDYRDTPMEEVLRKRDVSLLKLREFLKDLGEI